MGEPTRSGGPARPAFGVQTAGPQDAEAAQALLTDWLSGAPGRGLPAAARTLAAERLGAALDDPDGRILLARDPVSDEPVGMAVVTLGATIDLVPGRSVVLSPLCVAAAHRRRGVARALLAAALLWAEERGAESLVVTVRPADREANRYWSRLGFRAVTQRRAAPLAVVRRSLTSERALSVGVLPVGARRRVGRVTAGGSSGLRRRRRPLPG